jgi:hypothetical protein
VGRTGPHAGFTLGYVAHERHHPRWPSIRDCSYFIRDFRLESGPGGGLNRSTQHATLYLRKMECGDGTEISSRVYEGRKEGVVGALAARGVFEGDRPSVWEAIIVYLFPGSTARGHSLSLVRVMRNDRSWRIVLKNSKSERARNSRKSIAVATFDAAICPRANTRIAGNNQAN